MGEGAIIMFRAFAGFVAALTAIALCGCGRSLSGTYRAEVHLMEGKQESSEPGYTLADVQEKLRQEPRSLVLRAGGRYEWHTGGGGLNEGKWRVEDSMLILRDDTVNHINIQPALQKDRRWRIGDGGEIINEGSYSYYNLEVVYRRE
jgi:hypothetical protein